MKINPTAQGLELSLYALEIEIKPHLGGDRAKATLAIVQNMLADILRRQGPQRDLLRAIIKEGHALRDEISEVVGSANGLTKAVVLLDGHFDMLAHQHEELTTIIARLCEELTTKHFTNPRTPELLRWAVEWEISYCQGIEKLPPIEPPEIVPLTGPATPPLTLQYLKDALVGRRGITAITELGRMSGGNGKQTFKCTVQYDNGRRAQLVVRKDDPAPVIMHGVFQTEQEFALVRSLNKTDLPVAHAYDFCPRVPGPQGVDGAFFTMDFLQGTVPSLYFAKEQATIPRGLLLQLAELLAKLHSIPLETFSDYISIYEDNALYSMSVTQRYLSEIEVWKSYCKSVEHLPTTYFQWLFDWLARNAPQDSRPPVLVHGDLNLHNVLALDGTITGIVDWETADFGAPEQDLAYLYEVISKNMPWEEFIAHYRKSGAES